MIKEIILQPASTAPQAEVLAEQLVRAKDATNSALRKPGPTRDPVLTMETISRTVETTPEHRRPKTAQQQVKVSGEMIPKLEKPLTDTLRERERLVKRFGVAAVDVLHLANGTMTVSEIAAKSSSERSVIEDVLRFAEKLGIVEFKQKS
jgi:predicted flap endonuclease-1-like 5' DNA nuclease